MRGGARRIDQYAHLSSYESSRTLQNHAVPCQLRSITKLPDHTEPMGARSQWGQLRSCVVAEQALCPRRRKLVKAKSFKINSRERTIDGAVLETVGEGRGFLTQYSRFPMDRGCSRLPTVVTVKRNVWDRKTRPCSSLFLQCFSMYGDQRAPEVRRSSRPVCVR